MRVDVISEWDDFLGLRGDWERVYREDPSAQLFLSWIWMQGWLPKLPDPWLVLACSEDRGGVEHYVAFWPIRIETKIDADGRLRNEIKMAGNHVADYTGFICVPDAEGRAIAAFARKLSEMRWSRLHLDNVRAPGYRLRQLLAHFSKSKYLSEPIGRVNKSDGIDNSICPFAELPAAFDDYLASLSANTRQKIRRLLRLVEDKGEYRITAASDETVARDLDILLGFWRKKWAPRKGGAIDGLVRTNRAMLLRSFELGLLYLPIIWRDDRPLVALATLTDETKGAYLFCMTGRDEDFEGPPLGMLLHAYSIRRAIQAGFVRYDFLRGNEAYKYSFASNEERIHCQKVTARSGWNEKLDPRTLPDALQLTTKLHQEGKLVEAERGYRQILGTDPRNSDALYRFGQLLSLRGKHRESKDVFTRLAQIAPRAPKAWFHLGRSCEALGEFQSAVQAYRNVEEIDPAFPQLQEQMARAQAAATTGQTLEEACA